MYKYIHIYEIYRCIIKPISNERTNGIHSYLPFFRVCAFYILRRLKEIYLHICIYMYYVFMFI